MFEVAALNLYRAVMWAGHFVCHQMPARSPHLFGVQLPLCWRCTGITVGALAFLVWLFRARRLPSLWVSVALALLMPLDVLQAVITRGGGDNARRLLTGALWGFFAAALSLHLFAFLGPRLGSRAPGAAAARGGDEPARENFAPASAAGFPGGARGAT